ncbi:cartilage-associated protein-like [Oncorhynchus keta]|uniref:cartilage-associated protein-like n=1 Tax=Oncorhynchus keta TaxID=8018 RepID=UPI0015F87593|nr:cartilage-associated protein-like [Oncorhynchus keta]
MEKHSPVLLARDKCATWMNAFIMVANLQRVKGVIFSISLCFIATVVVAQYDNYNFRHFPQEELMPIESAYAQGLDNYASENWTDCIKFIELSLRLHRLLKDSVTYCIRNCNASHVQLQEPVMASSTGDMQIFWRILMRASCLKKCRMHFPALSLPYPRKEVMDDFDNRSPYRYMYFAYVQTDDLQKALASAHTYLQRNPEDPVMTRHMNQYKREFDLEGALIDHEERPYEVSFLKAVTLFNSEDFSSSISHMEQALSQYLQQYSLCQAMCHGACDADLPQTKDLYPTLADAYVDALRCEVKCEENLMPNVGGYFVEKFIATMYHYLQFAYYKLNDARSAAPCASSYVLFDPEDKVMRQNMLYYQSYREQWGLDDHSFTPRVEALRYYNHTTLLKQMLAFAENYLQSDEDFLSPEEAAMEEDSDVEFEGIGDYQESILARWSQPKAKGDVGDS